MTRSLTILIAVMSLLMVGSCGKKGELEPPEGYKKTGQVQETGNTA